MKNVLLILFGACSLFLAIYYYLQFDNTRQQLELANQRILDRDTQIYGLQKRLGIFRNNNSGKKTSSSAPSATTIGMAGALNAAEINQLKKLGLENPEADLKKDLQQKQQQLLKQKGSMGGTMAIRDIRILNAHHALAYFEDGHKGGYMLLRYEAKAGGRISWTVLDTFLM